MANTLNRAGAGFASSLIRQGKINRGTWSFSGADGNALLGPNKTDFATFGRHHLGRRTGATPNTKNAFSFPFAKRVGGQSQIFVAALRAIRSRAAQQNARDIFNSAGRLLARAQRPRTRREDRLDVIKAMFGDTWEG